MQNVDRWLKPLLQSFIAAPRLSELIYLVLKYGHDSHRRVAFLQLGGKRMSGKILFGLSLICLEGFFKNGLEIGRGCRRYGGLGHRAGSRTLTHMVLGDGDG